MLMLQYINVPIGCAVFRMAIGTLCDEKDILLIFDEVQCGMGRCGSLYAHDLYGVKPDVMALAKALGCGVPVGAFVTNEKASHALVPGDHGTTYGGNPFATAAVCEVFRQFEERDIVSHVNEVGAYLYEKLEEVNDQFAQIKAHRGVGLMQGLEFENPVGDVIVTALKKGLVIISAGANIIRFVPPLVIEKKDVDEMIAILTETLKENGIQ